MIDKIKIEELMKEEKYLEVLDIFIQEYYENLNKLLQHFDIAIPNEDSTLIEYIHLVDSKLPNYEWITRTPTSVVYVEHNDLASRLRYGLKYHDTWMKNLNEIMK